MKKRKANRLISSFGAILMLFASNVMPAVKVFAAAPTNTDNYVLIEIRNANSMEDKDNANSIVANYTDGTLTVGGTGLYSVSSNGHNSVYAPVGSNITFDANGAEGYSGRLTINGEATNGSTKTYENIANTGGNAPTYQVDAEFINCSQPVVDSTEINYSYTGSVVEFFINDEHFDFEHANPGANSTDQSGTFEGEINYSYDGSETVTIDLGTLFIDRITSLVINNEEYATKQGFPTTPEQILNAIDGQVIRYTVEVPYAATYDIVTTTVMNENEYMVVGNFLWSYQEKDKGTDDYVGNGLFELVNVKYNGETYTEAQIASAGKGYLQWWQIPDDEGGVSEGGALLPYGAELTVKLLPDVGYQLTSFTINGGEFEPGEEPGVYTFEVPRGNFHLGASFTKVKDEVNSEDSDVVDAGSIVLTGNESDIENGTTRLDVKDVELDEDDISNFEDAAGDYQISNYLDISLYNTIYKGTLTDSWDMQLEELDNDAIITLKLADDVDGNEVVIVHQKHDGTYEIIPTTYDPATHTIRFRTSSFSNYAIASKTTDSPDTGFESVKSGAAENAVLETVFVSAVICGLGLTFVARKRQDGEQ